MIIEDAVGIIVVDRCNRHRMVLSMSMWIPLIDNPDTMRDRQCLIISMDRHQDVEEVDLVVVDEEVIAGEEGDFVVVVDHHSIAGLEMYRE